MGSMQRAAGAFAATAIRRGAKAPKGSGSGGIFENRLHGNFVDPWQHRTINPTPQEAIARGKIGAAWALKGAGQNAKFLPWAGAGLLLGYFMIQDALPESYRP